MNRIRVFRHWRFGICTERVFGRFRCRCRQPVDMSDPHRNVAYIILGEAQSSSRSPHRWAARTRSSPCREHRSKRTHPSSVGS